MGFSREAAAIPGYVRAKARYLFIRLRLDGEAHVRPEEAASAALGEDIDFEPGHLVRTRLLARRGDAWRPLLEPAQAETGIPVAG